MFNGLMVGSVFILPENAIDDVWLFIKKDIIPNLLVRVENIQPLPERLEHTSHTLIIEENTTTTIGRRYSQPLRKG